ncbi:hypothetical protein MNBD_GAMMA21-2524 [hydrothermal vent metagenome]|uniref:Organic solvent tolerance-like N-terminal domain-containing protein n=1 Tax=hydrothermal vent metagenome TaxID=652676 RepID=A0A3B1ABQ0_9ZZZZ
MYRINGFSTLIVLATLLMASTPSWALRSDRNQPINIKADRVEINEKTETSHYQGNVYLKQGSLIINADSIMVYLKEGKLIKIIIDGSPATFEQKPEDNKDVVQSSAQHMEYYATRQLLILKQDARIIQGANNFSGDFIEYDTLNSTVKANKDENSDSRVHAIIQPKKDTAEDNDAPNSTPIDSKSDAKSTPPANPEKETPTE